VGRFAGPIALLVALAEIGFWITALGQMNFDKPGPVPNFDQRWSWFSDLGVSYHVGFYGFTFWLAGLTVVVMAAAIAYGFWVGRDRPSAYFGLMLFLTSATVGVFASQDLLLFYVFFEAMMIPLYLLIGVWGGPGRLGATIKFVIYTMAGSLLMLASVIVFGLSAGSFDLVTTGTSDSTWVFLGFLVAFAIKAPLFPLHGWLPDAYRQSTPEVTALLSGVISKAGAYGLIRFAVPLFPATAESWQWLFLGLGLAGLLYASLVAFRQPDARGVIAYSSLGQMNLIVIGIFASLPSSLHVIGGLGATTATVATNDNGITGAKFQMVNHGVVSLAAFLLIGLTYLLNILWALTLT
jgi:NADH-quinone oxidoreductase subunit M